MKSFVARLPILSLRRRQWPRRSRASHPNTDGTLGHLAIARRTTSSIGCSGIGRLLTVNLHFPKVRTAERIVWFTPLCRTTSYPATAIPSEAKAMMLARYLWDLTTDEWGLVARPFGWAAWRWKLWAVVTKGQTVPWCSLRKMQRGTRG